MAQKKISRPKRRLPGGVVNVLKTTADQVTSFTEIDASANFFTDDIPESFRALVILGHDVNSKFPDTRAEIRFRPEGESVDFKDAVGFIGKTRPIVLDGGGDYESGGLIVEMEIPVSEEGKFEYQHTCFAESPLVIIQMLDVSSNENSSTVEFTLIHDDFDAAATTNNIEVMTVPAGAVIESVIAVVTEAFAGGAISAYTIEVGQDFTPDTDAFLKSMDVTATGLFGGQDAHIGADLDGAGNAIYSISSSVELKAKADSVGANLDQATAGEIAIYIKFRRLP